MQIDNKFNRKPNKKKELDKYLLNIVNPNLVKWSAES